MTDTTEADMITRSIRRPALAELREETTTTPDVAFARAQRCDPAPSAPIGQFAQA